MNASRASETNCAGVAFQRRGTSIQTYFKATIRHFGWNNPYGDYNKTHMIFATSGRGLCDTVIKVPKEHHNWRSNRSTRNSPVTTSFDRAFDKTDFRVNFTTT